jgi:hypothetical protein
LEIKTWFLVIFRWSGELIFLLVSLAAAIGLILVLKHQSKGTILSLVNAGMFVAAGLDKLKL